MEVELHHEKEYEFLQGGGELGELTRSFDWSSTPVGEPSQWPEALKTTVSMILASKFPMFLWWGPDLIQFYNDAYRPSLGNNGKHPAALGQCGADCWPEIWPIIYPQIRQVLDTGVATWHEDMLVPIYRNGQIEDVYWTYGYSAIRGSSQKIEGVLVVCQETTEKVRTMDALARSRKSLKESERNLRNTILQAPVAMCFLKGDSYVVDLANERMFELWGKPQHEILNRPIFEGLPEVQNEGFKELLDKVYQTGESFLGEDVPASLTRDGSIETKYINFLYEPYREEDGRITGILTVAVDVTSQVLAKQKIEEVVTDRTRELLEVNQRLKKSNSELQEFAYVASHDLQEPLRKISTFAQMLQIQMDAAGQHRSGYVDKIKTSANRMSALIRDLLAYSQLSGLSKGHEAVDLNEVVHDILSDYELVISEKNALFNCDPLPVIEAVRLNMNQLFGNLISNALKYSSTVQRPEISITCEPLSAEEMAERGLAEGSFHKISVKDNGIGFDPKHEERIFSIFQRLHAHSEYSGTGIGLAICKKIVLAHGGQIFARSRRGEGAVFTVILPEKQNQVKTSKQIAGNTAQASLFDSN